VALIGDFYIQKYSNKYRKQINPLSEKLIQHLRKYEWPGNVRELQHSIERAVILCSNKDLRIRDFQFRQSLDETQALQFDNLNLNMIEKWAVESCLEKHQGHITKAAQELGITRGALYRRFDKHEIKKY